MTKKARGRPKGSKTEQRAANFVNLSDLSAITGRTINTLKKWVKDGMPYEKQPKKGGQGWLFDTSKVIHWIGERGKKELGEQTASIEESRRRQAYADAELKEIELAERRGEVVSIEEVGKVWDKKVITVRQRFRGVAPRVAPMLVGEDNQLVIQEKIEAEIDDALRELADSAIGVDDIEGGSGESDTEA